MGRGLEKNTYSKEGAVNHHFTEARVDWKLRQVPPEWREFELCRGPFRELKLREGANLDERVNCCMHRRGVRRVERFGKDAQGVSTRCAPNRRRHDL